MIPGRQPSSHVQATFPAAPAIRLRVSGLAGDRKESRSLDVTMLFLVMIGHQTIQQPHTPPRAPTLVDIGLARVKSGACDIKMCPRYFVVNETLDELGGGDRSTPTTAAR